MENVLTLTMDVKRHSGRGWRSHPLEPSAPPFDCAFCFTREPGLWKAVNVRGRVLCFHSECEQKRMLSLAGRK
jgi:hypothetical protein